MATAPSPNDLTRQQLDELDALLQRMLSVPLAPTDTPMPNALGRGTSDDPAPLPPSWRINPPAPAAVASLPHIALAEPPSSVKFEPPTPPPATPKPVAKTAPAPSPPAPVPAAVPKAPAVAPAPTPAPKLTTPAPVAITPVPSAPPVALPLLPLVGLNSLFDAACGMFGPPGRVLRSGFFKHLYGLIGLGLLAYTVAHVAQVQGWVTLPVVLPWPR